jgi:dolichol kinase
LVAVGCISLFYPIQFALLPAIVATIIEALPLDDNLWVPLFTAITLILII